MRKPYCFACHYTGDVIECFLKHRELDELTRQIEAIEERFEAGR
jgi:hypothetical protein